MSLAGTSAAGEESSPDLMYGTPQARWVLAATVLGSGIAFLDGTVVNVALPAIGSDFDTSISGLQWTIDAYLVTLSALLLLGGSLGDRFGRRRVFLIGLAAFTVASLLCALAPTVGFLIAMRALQGVGGALLVPGSLAIIAATFHRSDRGRAIGAWSGLASVTSAVGPFIGGWLIGAVSWRLIFVINVPIAIAAGAIAARHVPETRSPHDDPVDVPGAVAATIALGAFSFAAIEHSGMASMGAFAIGLAAAGAFVWRELTTSHPMLPFTVFKSRQFSGANLTTLAVYGALGAALFLVVLQLQVSLGYSPLEAGAALVPFTGLMLVVSPAAGQFGQRVGARIPMTIGPLITAFGMLLFSGVAPGSSYLTGVLPAVLVFGLGMAITVAPLTAAVLGGVTDDLVGVASGINNTVARLAGLLAVAVLPAVAGISTGESIEASLDAGYTTALRISAVLCVCGAAVAWLMVRQTAPARTPAQPSPFSACQDPCVQLEQLTGQR